MAGFGDGYVGSSQDAHRAFALGKERERTVARANEEKQKLRDETAAYRLKNQDAKFSSSTNATEVLLGQQTVGLVTKEEYARRRMALEGTAPPGEGIAADEAAAAATGSGSGGTDGAGKEKKKKKAKEKGTLSFAMDDGEDVEEGDEELVRKKPKKNPNVDTGFIPEMAKEEPPDQSATIAPSAPKAVETTPLPAGYSCVKPAEGAALSVFELSLEVMASASVPRTRVTGIHPQSIALAVKGTERNDEANIALCGFLRSALGGEAISCDVVRGHKVRERERHSSAGG